MSESAKEEMREAPARPRILEKELLSAKVAKKNHALRRAVDLPREGCSSRYNGHNSVERNL
jgi:hypothetical protein